MSFGKNLLRKLTLALAMVVPASHVVAAEAWPLQFEGVPEVQQQVFWNDMMKFKVFGAHGIDFAGMKILVPDSSGWFGTANGDFTMEHGNIRHVIGGPLMVGGNFVLSDGNDSITTGPVRVLKDIIVPNSTNWKGKTNLVVGTHCVKGNVDSEYERAVKGDVYAGSNYENCPVSVPQMNTELIIPGLVAEPEYEIPFNIEIESQTYNIDIPAGEGTYDLKIPTIVFGNNARLVIRMPAGGRLTRIFLTNGFNGTSGNSEIKAGTQIRVVYMSPDATYDEANHRWNGGSEHAVANDKYAGNLLFYTTRDVKWAALQPTDSIQGTFISAGTISVQQHMTLAGQLLADKISINAEFDGSGFRYVPFDPPELDIDPELFSSLSFIENDKDTIVPVQLSKNTEVEVYFSYCLDVPIHSTEAGKADSADFSNKMPICSKNEHKSVTISAGNNVPAKGKEVILNVRLDGIPEGDETVLLKIFDMHGAVMPGNLFEGYFELKIADVNQIPATEDIKVSDAIEDKDMSFGSLEFSYTIDDNSAMKGVVITSAPLCVEDPTKICGSITYKGNALPADHVVPVDSIKDIVFRANENEFGDNYATVAFSVVARNDQVSPEKNVTIDVLPDNDAPVVVDMEFTIPEMSDNVYKSEQKIVPFDVDDNEYTFAFDDEDENFAKVSELYVINADGSISPKEGAALDYESADSVLTVKVKVTDAASTTGGEGKETVSFTATIKLLDVNEKPVAEEQFFTIAENALSDGNTVAYVHTFVPENGTPVSEEDDGRFIANDPDRPDVFFGHLTYTIATEVDESFPFEIDYETGKISLKEGASLDYEGPETDFFKNHEYSFTVLVADDGDGNGNDIKSATATVHVALIDVNEPPKFVKDDADHYNVEENKDKGFVINRWEVSDEDGADGVKALVSTITDTRVVEGAVTAEDLFKTRVVEDEESGKIYVELFVENKDLLDFEAILDARQDSVFDVVISLLDQEGKDGCNKDTLVRKIYVDDVNEKPEVADQKFKIEENVVGAVKTVSDTPVAEEDDGRLLASDPDRSSIDFGTLVYTIPVNEDEDETNDVPFAIDLKTGLITVTKELDYEDPMFKDMEDPSVSFEVKVEDKGGKSETANVVVSIKNKNEDPTIDDDGKLFYDVEENRPVDFVIKTWPIHDEDGYDGLEQLSVSFVDNKKVDGKVSAEDLFGIRLVSDDNDSMFIELFVKNNGDETTEINELLDFEAIMDARGDSVFNITLTLKDKLDGEATLTKDIHVRDINEAPTFVNKDELKKDGLRVDENSKIGDTVGVAVATDPDKWAELTYTLADGDDKDGKGDAEIFKVDANGVITVNKDNALDYEKDSIYVVKVIVTDNGEDKGFENMADTVVVTITLNDKNENPEIIPDGDGDGDDDSDDNCLENCEDDPNDPSDDKRVVTVGIDENSPTNTVVFAYVVKDEDKGDLEKLAATLVQDGTTKPYIADSLFKIEVVPVDEASSKVVVSVRDGSKLDYEKIDSIYNVSVIVYDKTDKNVADTLVRIIKVKDVNEAPTFVNKEELKKDGLRVDENSKIGDTVGVAVATDPDKWAELTYTLADGDDKDGKGDAEIFKVDANGVITVNKDNALDYEKDSIYVVKVIVTDNGKEHGFENMADTVVVTITLNDKNENPEIIPDGDGDGDDDSDDNCLENCEDDPNDPSDDKRVVTVGIDENSPTNTVVFAYVVKDEDKGDLEKLAATLVQDGTTKPYIADSLFKIEVVPVDEASSKVVVSVRDGSKLDYEKIDSIYNVSVIVYDKTDKNVADTLVRIIKVKDVNEAPTFVNKEELKKDGLRVDENSKLGDTVGVAVATDPDKWAELTYTLADGDDKDGKGDAEIFKVDANGVITVNKDKALDYEKDSVYVVKVIVTDNGKAHGFENMADTVTVKITLNDKPENPTIVVDDDDNGKDDTEDDKKCVANCSSGSGDKDGKILTVGVEENVPTNTVVFEYVVEDPDEDQVTKLVPTLKDVNKTGVDSLFDVKLDKDGDKYKVVVFVKDSSKLDYETINPEHKVTLIVTDATDRQDSVVRIISVIDVNEAPVIVKQDFEFPEHNKKGSVVDTIKWGDDLDTKDPSFRDNMVIAVGGDTTLFAVDEAGVITTKKSFNYEDDKDSYILVVKVQDKKQPELFVVDTMHIALTNIKEDPYITSTEFEIPENPGNKDLIGTITSEDLDDPENKEERTYALIGTSEFVTVTEDGKILVKDSTKFDYETTPSFDIKVSVTDPTGIKKDTTITVKVGDVNEAPTVEDQKFTVNENIKTGDSVGKIVAEDPDTRKEYSELTFTPICEAGSKACEKFDVKKDGTIKVAEPLDYETDSVYTIKVQVSDGTYADTATVTIKVKDVIEKSVVEITKVDNSDSTWTKKDIADRHDTLYTNIPDNTITWTQDGVEMSMDTTLHDGPNRIIITYKDPAKNEAGSDTVVIFFSDATPIVTVTAGSNASEADNIYTVVQGTDKADSNIYVNSNKNDVVVTVLDPASGKTDTFTVKVDLDTVHVSKDTYTQVNKVKGEFILNENPSSGVSRVPMNDDQVKVSYEEKVDGKTYTVSYNTDKSGNPVKVPVVGSKGKIDSIEVITVSYVTTIGGKDVTISYKADALTGEALVTDTDGNLLTTAGVEAINKDPSKNPNKNPSSSSSGSHNSGSSSGSSSGSNSGSKVPQISTGALTVTYDYVDETTGNTVTVSYVVDEKGNIIKNDEGDTGYNVSYTFVNKYGNAASTSVFIVLDKVGPKVEILSPEGGAVIRSNFVNVVWSVDGVIQDTLTTQGLEKGFNSIVRFYKDKAGNEASDTIFVIMKDGKDLDVAVVNPVTEMTQDRVDRYYASNPPKEGETYAVSIKNPSTGKEVETLIGGSFDTKEGSGKEPYPGHSSHLGPTLAMDVKLPMVNDVGGMATLDDLLSSDGLVPLEGVDAKNSEKVTVEEYVHDYCSEKFQNKFNSDFKGKIDQANLYNSKMDVHIWIYTNLGGFVDYYNFTQKLNDPSYTNEAALLNAYFEMKPDKDGNVHTENGKLLATGSYLYKVQVNLRSELQCTLPPVKDPTGKKKGDVIKTSEDMLKPFGYKRPPKK